MNKYLEKIAALAVIVKGNPKYLEDPKMKPLADKLYSDVAKMLKDRGYTVSEDPGLPMTSPDRSASLWVGHSRGIGRLRYAPEHTKTIELSTMAYPGPDPNHYVLSPADISALSSAWSWPR